MEAKVIAAAIQSRRAFGIVGKLEGDKSMTTRGKQVWKAIAAFYDADPDAKSADPELIQAALVRKHPTMEKQFVAVFENLPKVSAANVVEFLKATVQDALGMEIRAALDNNDGAAASEAMAKYQAAEAMSATTSAEATAYNVMHNIKSVELLAPFKEGTAFKFLPKQLAPLLDGTMPGDHILIFAPVNVGKSCVAINMAYGLCRQGKKVLFIANEGPQERNYLRVKCRFSGMTRQQIDQHPEEADRRAQVAGMDNFFMVQLHPGSVDDVMKLCEQVQPDVCMVDQVINLQVGGKEPSKTEKLEQVCYALRMFYNKHHILGVSVAQADEKAINKSVLEIRDVYYSNVGVQAQVDIMIGLGASREQLVSGRRYIQVCKNKASGIHDGFPVYLNQQLSRLEE